MTARHLSFVETGRAQPSRELVLLLADSLDVPAFERNGLVIAAGYAPQSRNFELSGQPLEEAKARLLRVLDGYDPYPAVLCDRYRNILAGNVGSMVFVEDLPPDPGRSPNALRSMFGPGGNSTRVRNLDEWSKYLLGGVRRQALATGDPELWGLYDEVTGYLPGWRDDDLPPDQIGVPLLLETRKGLLTLSSTITSFGASTHVPLPELSLVAFLPGNAVTAEILHEYAREFSAATE